MTPTFITKKKSGTIKKLFNIFLLTVEEYENLEDRDFENEISYFQDQSIEMEGYCSDITDSDKTSMYYSMEISTEDIEKVVNSQCVVITSIYL